MMSKHGFSSSGIGKNSQKHINEMIKRLVEILNKIGMHALFLLACTLFAYMLLMFVLTLMGVFS